MLEIDVNALSEEDEADLVAKLEAKREAKKAKLEGTFQALKELFEAECVKENTTLEAFVARFFPAKTSSKPTKGSKIPPKYRNPDSPDQIWTGQGSPPKWLRDESRHDATWTNADAQKWAKVKGYLIADQIVEADDEQAEAA